MSGDGDVKLSFRTLRDVEREHVLNVLDALRGNKRAAALALGISRKKLYAMLSPQKPSPQLRRT